MRLIASRNTIALLTFSLLAACGSPAEDKPGVQSSASLRQERSADMQALTGVTTTVNGKSIDLPHYVPDFPPGPGQELFMNRCGVCHSLRYVTMQPDFSRKTWTKEVDKMIHTYGAHITKEEADQITEYLWTIKGKKDASVK